MHRQAFGLILLVVHEPHFELRRRVDEKLCLDRLGTCFRLATNRHLGRIEQGIEQLERVASGLGRDVQTLGELLRQWVDPLEWNRR
jgi:hypothetical protein